MKNFGHIIAKLRKEKGLTQAELGKKLNVSYQAVSKWENNLSQPDLDTISRMTEIFEISIADFFAMLEGKEIIKDKSNIDFDKINKIKETLDGQNKKTVSNQALTPKKIDPLDNFKVPKKSNFSFKKFIWALLGGLSGVVLALTLIVFLVPVTYSQNQVHEIVNSSVFAIETQNNAEKQYGTGLFINDSGLAVTPYSVVEDATEGRIQFNNGKIYDIEKLVGFNEEQNIALIQIDISHSTPAKFGGNVYGQKEVYIIYYPSSINFGYATTSIYDSYVDGVSGEYFSAHCIFSYYTEGGIVADKHGKILGMGVTSADALNAKNINNINRDINLSLSENQIARKTFKFYSDGEEIASKHVYEGCMVEKIENPIKTGYTFEGWYTDDTFTTEFDFNAPILDKLECYAKWTPIKYTVMFVAEASSEEGYTQEFTFDGSQPLMPNAFTKAHHTFKYWEYLGLSFTDKQSVLNLTNITETITLVAVWEENIYSIVLNLGFDSTSQSAKTYNYKFSENTALPNNPFTREGYIFAGWKFGEKVLEENADIGELMGEELTLEFTALWTPINYEVVFMFEETEESYSQTFTYDQSQTLLPNTFKKYGYHFVKWQIKGVNLSKSECSDQENVLNLTSRKSITLYAVFEINTFTIILHSDLNGVPNYQHTYKFGDYIHLSSDFDNEGYHVSEWKDSKGNIITYDSYVNEELNDVTIDLYPTWEENVYYIDYHMPDEELISSVPVKYFEEYTIIDCPNIIEGYKFSHWNQTFFEYSKDYNTGDIVKSLNKYHGGNIYLTAVFVPIAYTIVFDANGGTGTMANAVVEYDSKTYLNKCDYVYEGYEFGYWLYGDVKVNKFGYIDKLSTIDGDIVVLKAIWFKGLEGEGTEELPHLISSIDELNMLSTLFENVRGYSSRYFALTADLDATGKTINTIPALYGGFDGRNHTISNITANDGLFLYIWDATVKNLKLENYTLIDQDGHSAILTRQLLVGSIENCSVTGTIIVNELYEYNNYGGLTSAVGNSDCIIKNCYSNVNILIDETENNIKETECKNLYVGGFAGHAFLAYSSREHIISFENCVSIASISIKTTTAVTNFYVSGFIGNIDDSRITAKNCVAMFEIDVESNAYNYEFNSFSTKFEENNYENCYISSDSTFNAVVNGENITVSTDEVESVAPALLASKDWWIDTMLFDENYWLIEEGKMPVLKPKEEV